MSSRTTNILIGLTVALQILVVGYFLIIKPSSDLNKIDNTYSAFVLPDNTDISLPIPVAQQAVEPKQEFGRTRLLIMRHTSENIGEQDAQQAIEAANAAAAQGLDIRVVGNFLIGKVDRNYIAEKMKLGAEDGDNLILYSIGHGSGGEGYLQNVGKRADFMREMAAAAAMNKQETFWWQLSCHAAAGLPDISTFTPEEQRYFSAVASSPADKLSYFNTQGKIMAQVFMAMAQGNTAIDPNQDSIITAKEMRGFLDGIQAQNGKLLYAVTPEEEIFARQFLASLIPIVDRNESGRDPKDDRFFIPKPQVQD